VNGLNTARCWRVGGLTGSIFA